MATLPTVTSDNTPSSPCVLAPPSGIADGKRLYTVLFSDSVSPGTDPVLPGWTQLFKVTLSAIDGSVMYVFTKVASSEAGDYSWSSGSGIDYLGGCALIHDVDGSATVNQAQSTGDDTSHDLNNGGAGADLVTAAFAAGAVTSALATVIMLAVCDNHTSGTVTWDAPSGYSKLAEISDGTFFQAAIFAKNSVAAGFNGVLTAKAHQGGTAVGAFAAYVAAVNEVGGGSDSTQTPVGFGLAAAVGTPVVAIDAIRVSPIGIGLTAGLGTPTLAIGLTATPSGFGLTASRGTPAIAIDAIRVTPAGFGLTASRGTPTVSVGGPTITPSGFGLVASLGTPNSRLTLTPSGFGLVASLGTFTTQNDVTLQAVGFGLTASLGTPSRLISLTVSPAGFGLTASRGTPTIAINAIRVSPSGFALAATIGTPGVDTNANVSVSPTGFGMTASLGTPVVAINAIRVTPSGFGLSVSLGTPTVSTTANITATPNGFGLSAPFGTPAIAISSNPTVAPSGFSLGLSLGTPIVNGTSNITATPAGYGLAATLGSPAIAIVPRVDVETFPIDADTTFAPVFMDAWFTPSLYTKRSQMLLFECSRGDSGLSIRGTLDAKAGKLPNLTNATVTIYLGEPGNYVVAGAAVETINASTREVNFDLNPSDFGGSSWPNVPPGGGTYRVRFRVVRQDGAEINVPSKKKNRWHLVIREP